MLAADEAHAAIDDMLSMNTLGVAHNEGGARVVIEEFMVGEEASFIVVCDGVNALPLATRLGLPGLLTFQIMIGLGFGAGPYLVRSITGILANAYVSHSGSEVAERLDQVGAHVQVTPHHQVLDHRHAREDVGTLKRPGQSTGRDLMRAHASDGVFAKADLACLGTIEAAQAVHQRRLACAVAADHAEAFAAAQLQAHVFERPVTAAADAATPMPADTPPLAAIPADGLPASS